MHTEQTEKSVRVDRKLKVSISPDLSSEEDRSPKVSAKRLKQSLLKDDPLTESFLNTGVS